jgi:DNA gyrase/topoisomerase IV subunit A
MKTKSLTVRSDASEIRDYLRADDKTAFDLSEGLLKKLEMIDRCKELIAKDKFNSEIIETLQQEYGVKQRQAYNIIREADVVYGFRAIKIEAAFAEIRKTKELAMEALDPRAAAMSDRNYVTAIAKLLGEKEEDVYKNLQPVAVQVGEYQDLTVSKDYSREELLKFAEEYRKKHLRKALDSLIEDTDYEDIDEDNHARD